MQMLPYNYYLSIPTKRREQHLQDVSGVHSNAQECVDEMHNTLSFRCISKFLVILIRINKCRNIYLAVIFRVFSVWVPTKVYRGCLARSSNVAFVLDVLVILFSIISTRATDS